MSRKSLVWIIALVLAAVALGAAGVREILEVQVINFPDPQRIRGSVSIEGPIRSAEMVRFADVIVPPVKPTDTTRLISAGTLPADGYVHAVLSLSGVTKGDVVRGGSVGAYLVPDEEGVQRALVEAGHVQFPLEVAAGGVSGASAYFSSKSERVPLGFPRYRVVLWNTTDKTATVNLYAYLTH